MTNSIRYVAFLRGINVGGNKKVPMAELKKVFESMGCKNVKTLLASGNVIFETGKTSVAAIEGLLKKTFGFEIPVILRTEQEIKKLIESEPFKGIAVTEQTRLYVTFLSEKPTSKLKIPYESPEKDFKILSVTDTEICSVLTVSPQRNSTDAMNILEKEFGKKVTTRNWNTVMKVHLIKN